MNKAQTIRQQLEGHIEATRHYKTTIRLLEFERLMHWLFPREYPAYRFTKFLQQLVKSLLPEERDIFVRHYIGEASQPNRYLDNRELCSAITHARNLKRLHRTQDHGNNV